MSLDPVIKTKAILSWSSGKDSAYSLFTVLNEKRFEVVALLTTVTETFQRVSMHGVREAWLEAQAAALEMPIHKIKIPSPCSNEIYEAKMADYLNARKKEGLKNVIFGDLFLEDLRKYREQRLAEIGMTALFPLWLRDTRSLAEQMIGDGFEAVLACVD